MDETPRPRRNPEDEDIPRGGLSLISYKVDELRKDFDKVNNRLETLILNFATKAELADVEKRLDKLSENIGWAVKIVLGGVLAAVLGLVIAKGGTIR